jgi:hypothetical protein
MYFKQAALGVPVRMALITLLLGVKETPPIQEEELLPRIDYPIYQQEFGVNCPNPRCVSGQKTETKYLKPEFKIVNFRPLNLRCIYCEHGFEPKYVASTDWHDHWARKIRPEHLIIFDSEKEALAHGFKPSHYAKDRGKKDSDNE